MQLNYSQVGQTSADQTPLVILHGLFGSLGNWRLIAQKLSKQYSVISVDLRNHGASPHAASMSYEEMADDVLQLLDQLDLDSVHLIGHSMGGKVAMCCALLNEARIKSLCVVDIAPVAYKNSFNGILSALQSLPLDMINSRSEADQILSEKIAVISLRQFLLQNLIQTCHGCNWRINLDTIDDQIEQLMGFPDKLLEASCNKPVRFIYGELSDYIQPTYQELIKKLFPNAQIKSLADCGHWLHAEKPDLFHNSLVEFLDENAN